MAETDQGSNGRVFISYSRRDKRFVKKLNDALDQAGVHAWVDWEGIELAADWMAEITESIQASDAFLFVISPDSLKSKICAQELELGLSLNKKLIPILYREPEPGSKMHEKLAATNWVYMRQEDNFKDTLPRVVEAINTDLDWVRRHTQLLTQALEWEKRNKNNSFLLSGAKLQDAEHWMMEASEKSNRQILPIQAEYIQTSRAISVRNQRRLTITMSLLFIASVAFAIYAFMERGRATENERKAVAAQQLAEQNAQIARIEQARAEDNARLAEEKRLLAEEKTNLANAERSAAQARAFQSRAGELDTSTLLAIDSYRRSKSSDAENLIRINTSLLPVPVAQMKQDGAVWNIEWTPDHEYFVTGNNTDVADPDAVNEACVWRGNDGEKLYCVTHEDDVNDAIFSKDGKYLITGSADRTVKFWDALTGAPVESLNLQLDGAVLDLDANDSVLAIGREDNYLTLYYFNKPDLDPYHYEQVAGVGTVKFSPNGVFLAFGLQNGKVRFWQANNLFFYEGPTHERSSYVVLAFSPDSNWLVSGGGDSIARLTKRDGTPKHQTRHQDWVEGVAFGPDPSWYVTASDDNIVRVLETDTHTSTERFRMIHSNFVQRVTVSPDGQWIASTGYDETVRIWDSVSGSQMLEIPLDSYGSAISFNRDATRLVAADEDGNISIWDISKLKARVGYIVFTEFLHEARFTPSGEFLVVNGDDYTVRRIPAGQVNELKDGTKGEVILTTDTLTYNTAISPDSQWLAVVEYDSEDAKKNRGALVSMDGGIRFPLEHGGEVTGVAFTQDSQLVATSGVDGRIRFWGVQNGEEEFSLDLGEKIYSLAISPNSALTAAGLNNRVLIWDHETREQVTELSQPGDSSSLAFSPDGKLLATGSSDGSVVIWSIEGKTFTQQGETLRLNGFARALAFSPDDNWLAGGGSTNFAYLWDVATTQELARIAHGNPVTGVSFSPDGSQLFTVSRKLVRIWEIAAIPKIYKDELISTACSHLIANFSRETWTTFFGEEEYVPLCPAKPEGD